MTIFEPAGIPSRWAKICNENWINEIWLPSKFNINTFSKAGVNKAKLHIMHYCINTENYKPMVKRNNKKFRFTYIADCTERKNLPLLIKAFTNEFSQREKAELFIHTTSSNKEQIDNFINNNLITKNKENVIINTTKLSETEIINLLANSNLYISVDRANGWGMPCMEAMALGTLTATVNWSGSTEFMFNTNSLLIEPSRLVMVDAISALDQPYYAGQYWADVREVAIRKTLRKAYTDWDKLEKIRKVDAYHYTYLV